MQQDSQFTSAGTPLEGEVDESGRTVIEPRFDEETIRRARPATPLSRLAGNHIGPRLVIAACLTAGIAAGVLSGLAAVKYYNRSAAAAPRPEIVETANANETAPPPAPSQTPAADVVSPTPPLDAESNNAQPANERDARREGGERLTVENKSDPERDNRETVSARDAAAGQRGATHDALRSALGEWVAATNARDTRKQMAFYSEKVDAFYRERNASRDVVRQEKERAFGKAERVAIRAGAPDIKLSPDGRTATMLFRKEYEIKRGSRERKGAVLQELRWRRSSDGGWKIVYERDVRVLN